MTKSWIPDELMVEASAVRKNREIVSRSVHTTLDEKIDSLALQVFEEHSRLFNENNSPMPWAQAREEAVKTSVEDFPETADTIFPIITARIASEMDPYSMGSYTDMQKGLFLLATCKVGYFKFNKTQVSSPYSKLVPRFLVGYKKFNNIPYSKLPLTALTLGTELFDLISCNLELYNSITREEALELRKRCLGTAKSVGNPQTNYSIYRTKGTKLEELPVLARITALQIWAAHPSNRTEYMILDPNNVDNMPEPLLDGTIQKYTFNQDAPW